MRPAYTRPSARLLRLGALLYQPLDCPVPPIAERKPAADHRPDLADVKPAEPKDTVPNT